MRYLLGFLTAILLLVVAGFAIVLTGAYDVAAAHRHTQFVNWALDRSMENSVRRRAAGTEVPMTISEAQVRQGLKEFQDSCVYCHGAPGVEPTDWAKGMLPRPPNLARTVPEWKPEELFWIVRNGIKMTGMPAFGAHLNTEQIWGVVGFIQRLPKLSPQEYERLTQQQEQTQ